MEKKLKGLDLGIDFAQLQGAMIIDSDGNKTFMITDSERWLKKTEPVLEFK